MKLRKVSSLIIVLALSASLCSTAFAAGKPVSDDTIYDYVKRRLANDPVVKGGALDIDVKQGVVTLKGSVEYEKQKTKAEKVAKKVNGVKQVINQIQVVRR
jgi:osmotically-inducible protein OsmY